MGRAILCIGNYAKNPYYIEKACIHIYSIEELCFYLSENAFLLEKGFVNNRLIEWIGNECGLEELSKELHSLAFRKTSLSLFVKTILERTYYCTEEKITEIETMIKESSSMNLLEKRKTCADYLVKKGHLMPALTEYELLLTDIEESDEMLKGKVLHNMGTVFARMFEFQRAAECFQRAYAYTYQPKTYLSFLAAKRMQLEEKEYVQFATEEPKNAQMSMELERFIERIRMDYPNSDSKTELEEIKAYRSTKYASEYYQKIDNLIQNWKEAYKSYQEEY